MVRAGRLGIIVSSCVLAGAAIVACSAEKRSGFADSVDPNNPAGTAGGGEKGGFVPDGGFGPPSSPEPPEEPTRDPVTCKEAEEKKSYVGCDYWPTVTPNPVWSIFDYAVVVANTGATDAHVTVTGPKSTHKEVTVPAGQLSKIYLPWIEALKGPDYNACTNPVYPTESSLVSSASFHLVSSSPVIVYQFNALEYKGEGGENPDGSPKDWSKCPGTTTGCEQPNGPPVYAGCFSFSNDASLLLPSTAMTNNYRVAGHPGSSVAFGKIGIVPTVMSITATQPNTAVTVTLSPSATTLSTKDESTIPATEGGQVLRLTLANAGDVAQLVTEKGATYDFSGSLVQSTRPVQVITSVPCINIPDDKGACDHIEETVLPAETLGKRYVVTVPTGPKGSAVKHQVRLFGNQNGTKLTYMPSKPEQCPDTLEAGQAADCGLVDASFEVTGSSEFGVATFNLGATVHDPSRKDKRGDPDQSTVASVEQFRTKYVFLAPNDYPTLYADITATADAEVELDGKPVDAPWTMIGDGPFGVYRVDLTKSGNDGAHTLEAKNPVGVQVLGYGDNTSFQYPAGLNLKLIAPPPTVPK